MEIIRTADLSPKQKEGILTIVEECRKIHPFTISFPFEDGAVYYMLCDPEPVCALALLLPDGVRADPAAECVAFTLPSRQRQGCFSALFEKASAEIEDIDLYFLTDGSDEGALKTLQALGAEPEFSEHRMELDLEDAELELADIRLPVRSGGASLSPVRSGEALRLSVRVEDTGEDIAFPYFLNEGTEVIPAGSCHFAVFAGSACLYGFEIAEPLRGRGLGYEALIMALAHMKRLHTGTVTLQVSGGNTAALRLYEKTGFRICETLSYYLY